jgi:hypothetical protein
MTSRITFLVVTLFWMTMTYELWRSEYIGHDQAGSSVPVELVWRKILTAPDNSRLEITHNGLKVGYCQWASSVGEDLASGKVINDDLPSASAARSANGYRLDLQGSVAWDEKTPRVGFETEIDLAANQSWQEFTARLKMKPLFWDVHSLASEQSVHFTIGDASGRSERVFHFADLQNPQSLMKALDLPASMALLGMLGALPHGTNGNAFDLGLKWNARNDWVTVGHTSVRAYRLEASVLERYRMRVIISRVGEILRIDLPDGWELENDQLTGL